MRATIEARRDLGPEYEAALIESFLDKVEASIAMRVRAEVDSRLGPHPYAPMPPPHHLPQPRANHDALWVAIASMALGIPLTGIAAGTAGTSGLFLAWFGIVLINVAAALSRRR